MSNKKNLGIKTLYGAILLNMILSTYHLPPNLFHYFFSYLVYINENIYNREKVEVLLSLSYLIYLIFVPFGIILNFYFNFNTSTLTGISLLLKIISNYILMNCSTNKKFILYLIIKSSSYGLCLIPVLVELWKYYPNKKGLITGVFYLGKGILYLIYEPISIKIINPKNINIIANKGVYPVEINENFYIYLKASLTVLCILGSLCQCLIYPYSIYINFFNYKKNKFKAKMSKGLLKDFYILSSNTNRNTIGSTKNSSSENWLGNSDRENEIKKEIKEPFFSLITSYPFIQLTFIYFLVMVFNSIDLSSIKKIGLNNYFDGIFLLYSNIIWKFTYIICNVTLGYIIDKIKIKRLLVLLFLIQIFSISIFYFITDNKYGFILFNILNSVINSSNNVVVPISFLNIFGEKNGILLYGISSVIINTFYIYRTFIFHILVEKIYYFVLCLVCTIFYMVALITLCLFEEKKHIYKIEDEGKEQIMFDDLAYEQELNELDICDVNEFKNINNED